MIAKNIETTIATYPSGLKKYHVKSAVGYANKHPAQTLLPKSKITSSLKIGSFG
jgi:hypothetical protein